MKHRIIICCALIVLILTAHAPALRASFVWDDTALILRDPLIRSWRLIPEGFQHFLFVDATPSNFYRPIQRLTYTLEYWAFAFRPTPYHFTNIFLHVAATLALFFFVLAFFKLYQLDQRQSLVVAVFASIAWALHPIHSAVVDYVAGRADSLAAIFGFIGLYFAIQALSDYRRSPWKFYAIAGLALLASALSKESGLLFAALAIALILLRKNWPAIVPAGIAMVFVLTIYLTLRSQAAYMAVPQLSPPAPALVRPIIAARALAEYTGLLFWPTNLHMDRDVENHVWGFSDASLAAGAWRELETLAGILVLIGLLCWMWRARKSEPAIFAILFCAAISYVPVSGIFPLNATIAEHWIYLPSAFALLAIGLQAAEFIGRNRVVFYSLVSVASLWIGFLGVRTFFRAQDWQDPRTFFEHTIAAGGDSARMLINLGALEMSEGHLGQADALLQRALAKNPDQPFALLDLAAVALKRNDLATARGFLERAQKNPVSEAQAQEMTAILETRKKNGINLLRLHMASRTEPATWSIMKRYVDALAETGRTEQAVTELQALLKTEWYRAESWQLLSKYLTTLGRADQAATASAQAHAFDVHLDDH